MKKQRRRLEISLPPPLPPLLPLRLHFFLLLHSQAERKKKVFTDDLHLFYSSFFIFQCFCFMLHYSFSVYVALVLWKVLDSRPWLEQVTSC